ncbi:MAG TPA: 50S ribosomal protein L11 methyltransferase [Gammaproteobacteria bacterium]|nr:50S ribosomal protein L11 methyltransferase [Gammaproteobacteria bacterium]
MIELHAKTRADYAEMLGDQFLLLGAKAVTFQDAGDEPIYEPDPFAPHFWQETIVIGLFDHDTAAQPILNYLENQQASGLIKNFHRKDIMDQDWERVCLEHFKPIQFGNRLWICPSWHTPPDPHAVNVILDPGLAFGTGTHPTTALCLEWLEEHIQQGSLVMDYGCGSGILGLAALKLGAQEVVAVDNDPQALLATQKNGQINPGISSKLQTCLPDEMPEFAPDVLIANILARPLIELAPRFASFTHPGSDLLLSGILVSQAEEVMKAYEGWFQFKKPIVHKNEWVRLYFVRS